MECWKEYVEYLKDNPEGHWFKRKLYGFGWTPAKWEGWAVLFGYVTLVFTLVFIQAPETADADVAKNILLPILAATILFIAIAWRTGESLKWQWGDKKQEIK